MIAVQETTVWKGNIPNHTYLLDGTKMVAYIKQGEKAPYYFKVPLPFYKSGRKFNNLKVNPFKKVKSNLIQVTGSKGEIYEVDLDKKTCTCPGYTFRGKCKHV